MKKLFGTDGVRGKVNETLTIELVEKICNGLSQVMKNKYSHLHCLVGIDTRNSSLMYAYLTMSILSSNGWDCDFVGVVPTPLISYIVREKSYQAGIMISASHNLYEYNGIKVFNNKGEKLDDALEDEIEKIISSNNSFTHQKAYKIGQIKTREDLIDEYIEYIIKQNTHLYKDYTLAFDCANGSTITTAEKIFSKIKSKNYYLNNHANGVNINYKCGATSIENLKEFVMKYHCDAGFSFDGDGDRLIAVDSLGRKLDGDFILSVIALYLQKLNQLPKNTVVLTIMSNLGLVKFLESKGINVEIVNVGDKYVYQKLLDQGLNLGGETSGHTIIRNIMATGCGELTAMMFLKAIKELNISIDSIYSLWEKYPQININIPANEEVKKVFKENKDLKKQLKDYILKNKSKGKIIARVSGTEELIRITSEAKDEKTAYDMASYVSTLIKNTLKI